MSEKHSPGPWKWMDVNGWTRLHYGVDGVVFLYHGPVGLCDADARLIAAAPELLEALKSVLSPSSVGAETLEEQHAVDCEAKALIRRIEGEE